MRSENKVRGCFVGLENRGNGERRKTTINETRTETAGCKRKSIERRRLGVYAVLRIKATRENARRVANKTQKLRLHESSKYYGVSISTVGFEHRFNQSSKIKDK